MAIKTTNKQTKNEGVSKFLKMGGMQQMSNSNIHSDIHVKKVKQTLDVVKQNTNHAHSNIGET